MEREESQVRRGKKVSVLRRFVQAAAEQIALCEPCVSARSVLRALGCHSSVWPSLFFYFFLNVLLHFALD